MGTTATAIQSGEGVRIGWVLAIEGYEYLITDGHPGQATTAWVGTGFEKALPGLEVRGSIRQSIEPWSDTIDVPMLTFAVMPDEDDTFGKAVFKSKPTFQSRFTQTFEPAADGTGTMTVKSAASFPSSGSVFYGGRKANYSITSGTTFTITTANANTPFSGNAGSKYSPPYQISSGDLNQTRHPGRVSDVPITWIGKKVALYLHRISGGVWDTRAQAQLEFAGKVTRVYEDERGFACLECEELRADIRDCVLLQNQWVGYVKEGIRLVAGTNIAFDESLGGVDVTFTVVASGASGTDETDEGYYSIYEFVSILDKWLQGESASLSSDWSAAIRSSEEGGLRFVITGTRSVAAAHRIVFGSTSRYVMDFLGFTPTDTSKGYHIVIVHSASDVAEFNLAGERAPYRIKAVPTVKVSAIDDLQSAFGYIIEFDQHEGVWWDHSAFLPGEYQAWADGGNYSFIQIGDSVYWGHYDSDTKLDFVHGAHGLKTSLSAADLREVAVTVEQPGESLEVRQVVCLAGSFKEVIPRLLASLKGDGTNHADYDAFPFGAGIPWSLLGDDFISSVNSLEQGNHSGGLVLVLEKPTKMLDVLLPELLLRNGYLVFKDGVFQIVSPPTPNSTTADHQLTEANKAGQQLDLRSSSEITHEWLRNVVIVDYGRDIAGTYTQHTEINDSTSIANYGQSQSIKIKARNSFADSIGTGATVEDLLINLESSILPFYSKPMKIVKRSIAPTLFHATPGDTASLYDDFVRDPLTGERGLEGRAGIIVSTMHDWGSGGGELSGEVTVMISDEDRTYPLSPCAQVDHTYTTGNFTAGYSNTDKQLKLVQHQHSRSTDAKDVSYWAAGDLITIVQVDPDDPTSYLTWDRVIDTTTPASDLITLTATLSSPAFDDTLRYRVIPQLYADVQATQKDAAFIADDADGMIQDVAEPNLYGVFKQTAFTASVPLDLPSLIADNQDDDGRPLTPGLLHDLGKMLNNLASYKAAQQSICIQGSSGFMDETGTSYKLRAVYPMYVGPVQRSSTVRYLAMAPEFKTTAGTGYVRITVTRARPKGTALTGVVFDVQKSQHEFTTTSTTATVPSEHFFRLVAGGGDSGLVYVCVEMKASSGNTTRFYGISDRHLSAIEDV